VGGELPTSEKSFSSLNSRGEGFAFVSLGFFSISCMYLCSRLLFPFGFLGSFFFFFFFSRFGFGGVRLAAC
jgi:hypothetical protein